MNKREYLGSKEAMKGEKLEDEEREKQKENGGKLGLAQCDLKWACGRKV